MATDALATLTTTVNQALIETGRFFRSSGSVQSRAQLKRSIPAAHEQFQFALDDLSEQIFLAKAFLERDYEAIQATKAENQPAQDVAMDEAGVKSEPEPTAPAPEETETGVAIKDEPQPATEDTTTNPPPAAEPSQPPEPDQPVKIEKAEETPAMPEQPLPPSAETKLETGLDDTGGAVNEFDLHLDFGDDEIGNQNFLSGSNIGSGGANEPGQDPSSSILTGTGGDAFDMELQRTEQPQQTGPDGQTGDSSEDIMAPGESSFDDLFMDSENIGEGGDPGLLEGDGLMNMNELDDNWFT